MPRGGLPFALDFADGSTMQIILKVTPEASDKIVAVPSAHRPIRKEN